MKACKNGHTSGRYKSGACRECSHERNRAWKRRNAEHKRAYARAYFHSLSDAKKREYLGLPEPSRPRPEACENCGRVATAARKLALDHCHATGKFRGWLCTKCNTGIGSLGDSIDGLKKALNYLGRAT